MPEEPKSFVKIELKQNKQNMCRVKVFTADCVYLYTKI